MKQKIKKLFLFFTAVTVSAVNLFAQDTITLKSNKKIIALVYETGDMNVEYKKVDNPNGPVYVLKTSEISTIKYANGSIEVFTNASSAQLNANDIASATTPLLILPSQLSFGPLGEEQQVEIQSDVEYRVKEIPWCTASLTRNLLTIKCLPNHEDSNREGTITVIANGKEIPITIRQERIKVVLLPPRYPFIDDLSSAEGSISIQVISNVPWDPFSDSTWCSVKKTPDNWGFVAQYGENSSGIRKTRTGIIADGEKISIDILQNTTTLLRTENWLDAIRQAVNSGVTKTYPTGKYKGGYVSNQREGLGICLWTSNTIYIGEWNAGNQQGLGIYMAPENYSVRNCPEECQFYVGEWNANDKSGMGNCYDEEGNLILSCGFEYDQPKAKYPMANISDYANYKFEYIKYANDNIYLGETYKGRPHGQGILLYKNSDLWYGQWENGNRSGYGIEMKANGNLTTGSWTGDTYNKQAKNGK